jgi:hypothetical protein
LLLDFEMAPAKMCARPLAPCAHEPVIQSRADSGTGERNQASRPLLDHFRAGLRCNSLDDARHKSLDDFLLHKFAADVQPCRAGCRDPQFGNLVIGVELKSIKQ